MDPQTLTFTLERETKTSARYRENLKFESGHPYAIPPAIGTLYVPKWLLGAEPPQTLTITISEVRAEDPQ